jgi:hypothetical protein
MPPSALRIDVNEVASINSRWISVSKQTVPFQPKRDLLPYSAIAGFTKDYEAPTMSEGFSEIKTINWVFEEDAEAKRRWSMWLQLDGERDFQIKTLMLKEMRVSDKIKKK